MNLSLSFRPKAETEAQNPVLAERELGIETVAVESDGTLVFDYDPVNKTTSAKFKEGDGHTDWNALPEAGVLKILEEDAIPEATKDVPGIVRLAGEDEDPENNNSVITPAWNAAAILKHNELSGPDLHPYLQEEIDRKIALHTRRRLSANANYCIDMNIGNDSNDGLSAAKAFKSWARMQEELYRRIDGCGYSITINVAPGEYTGPFRFESGGTLGLTRVFVIGADAATTIVKGSNYGLYNSARACPAYFSGFDVSNCATSVCADNGATLQLAYSSAVRLGLSSSATGVLVYANTGGRVTISGKPLIIYGGARDCFAASDTGRLAFASNADVSFENNPTFSRDIARSDIGGMISIYSGSISGNATGRRYYVNSLSSINTYGAGPNRFPGTIEGVSNPESGGYYL